MVPMIDTFSMFFLLDLCVDCESLTSRECWTCLKGRVISWTLLCLLEDTTDITWLIYCQSVFWNAPSLFTASAEPICPTLTQCSILRPFVAQIQALGSKIALSPERCWSHLPSSSPIRQGWVCRPGGSLRFTELWLARCDMQDTMVVLEGHGVQSTSYVDYLLVL